MVTAATKVDLKNWINGGNKFSQRQLSICKYEIDPLTLKSDIFSFKNFSTPKIWIELVVEQQWCCHCSLPSFYMNHEGSSYFSFFDTSQTDIREQQII